MKIKRIVEIIRNILIKNKDSELIKKLDIHVDLRGKGIRWSLRS